MTKAITPLNARRNNFARVRAGTVAIGRVAILSDRANVDLQSVEILGTGFLIDSRGIIVTAKHVVQQVIDDSQRPIDEIGTVLKVMIEVVEVKSDDQIGIGMKFGSFRHFRYEPDFDLAVMSFDLNDENRGALKPLLLSTEHCVEGDEVAVCGYPFGHFLHAEYFGNSRIAVPSFSQGIVSATLPHPKAPFMQQTFQMDAMINGGNSGGPVFNPATGDVVGIVTQSIMTRTRVLHSSIGGLDDPPQTSDPASGTCHDVDPYRLGSRRPHSSRSGSGKEAYYRYLVII
jgi:S1-C subfamily serine protease